MQEIELWIQSRRRNWPSKNRIEHKEKQEQIKAEVGLSNNNDQLKKQDVDPPQQDQKNEEIEEVVPPKLSRIEVKLRRKLKIIQL